MWFSMVCAFIDNDTGRHSGQIYCETVLREFNSCFDLFMHVDISKIFTGIYMVSQVHLAQFSHLTFLAILKICPLAIVTSLEVIIEEHDAILGQ